jgi:hypothetical protein
VTGDADTQGASLNWAPDGERAHVRGKFGRFENEVVTVDTRPFTILLLTSRTAAAKRYP